MTREEFIERIDEIMCDTSNAERAYLEDLYNEVTKPHWISVEDELPKEHFKDSSSKWVLVCTPLGSVYIDSYNHKNKEWVNNRKSITHWMPLPQAPTVAENATVKEKGGEP